MKKIILVYVPLMSMMFAAPTTAFATQPPILKPDSFFPDIIIPHPRPLENPKKDKPKLCDRNEKPGKV